MASVSDDRDIVTISIGVDDLLRMPVAVSWRDESVTTMAELVARAIAERVDITATLREEIAEHLRDQVAELVAERLNEPDPPVSGSLAAMIVSEARAQLGPAARYHGTSTPLEQWLASQIYEQLRSPQLAEQMETTIEAVVVRALRKIISVV